MESSLGFIFTAKINLQEPNFAVIVSSQSQFPEVTHVIIVSRTRYKMNLCPYSSLNVKELLAQNKRDIGSLSDTNEIRTHNHLVHKRIPNHLAELA